MDNLFKRRGIYWIVVLISTLLIAKVFISYQNSRVIDKNVRIQKEAERIKVNTLDIIRTLHLLDLGVRGYAIYPDDQIGGSYDSAWIRKEVVLRDLEISLKAQNFEMSHFYKMRDSVNSYFHIARQMMDYLKAGDRLNFEKIFKEDYGYYVWLDYKAFSARIEAFEDSILLASKKEYDSALQWSYMVLVVMLILIIPTLFYTAYQTTRTFFVLDQLKELERDKNRILATQNETLERLVKQRTEEIATQNEEILSQNEEIITHNESLKKAQELIEHQHELIKQNNLSLSEQVHQRTETLLKANKELAQNVSQLEQFTFIVSHNLRAPVARIMGLSEVLRTTKTEAESNQIIDHLVKTSQELDGILKDLNLTIQIKEMVNERLQAVDLAMVMDKVVSMLPELSKLKGSLELNLEARELRTISAYVESILFNLISNAIKYRDPSRKLVVSVETYYEDDFLKIRVQDSGLGIDLSKHQDHLFNLYKRFHFHIEGKGLGLYLVKTQVSLLGGDIAVESKVNEGTTFTVRIRHNNL